MRIFSRYFEIYILYYSLFFHFRNKKASTMSTLSTKTIHLPVYQVNNFLSIPSESIPIAHQSDSFNQSKLLVIIVDDNSGSMSGNREKECVKKTKMLIDECIRLNIPYQWATFGSRATIYGAIQSTNVQLSCHEGTSLSKLTEAAMGATQKILQPIQPNDSYRIMYVLNTDGEASDGQYAASEFHKQYLLLTKSYPNIQIARTFILGIGDQHDQKVLGSMAVGETTYINYPNASLMNMSIDTNERILPFLSNNELVQVQLCSSRFNQKRMISCSITPTGYLNVDQLCIQDEDDQLILPDGTIYQLVIQPLCQDDHPILYQQLLFLSYEKEIAILAESVRTCLVSNNHLQNRLSHQLSQLKEKLLLYSMNPLQKQQLSIQERKSMYTSIIKQSRQFHHSTVGSFKDERCMIQDKKEQLLSVIRVCENGLNALRIGKQLTTSIERDLMEILSSDGFTHWSNGQKQRSIKRALEQAEPNTITITSQSIQQLIEETPEELIENSLLECWFTLQPVDREDCLCLVGYIPPNVRNLPMCSLCPAKVLHSAILNEQISICPLPMSYLTMRQLLLNGQQITRGPMGLPINTIICLLPNQTSPLSQRIAKIYFPQMASQLLTTQFIYTRGTGDYMNGVLSAIISIMMKERTESLHQTFQLAIHGFCQSISSKSLQILYERALSFTQGACTSGEVATPIIAIGDQFIRKWCYQHLSQPIEMSDYNSPIFWRLWFFRLLRDKMDILFTAYCSSTDPNGNSIRNQKMMDAEQFITAMIQGIPSSEANQVIQIEEVIQTIIHIGQGKSKRVKVYDDDADDDDTNNDNIELDQYSTEIMPDESVQMGVQDQTSVAPPVTNPIDSLVNDMIDNAKSLPYRGHPDTLLSNDRMMEKLMDSNRITLLIHLLQTIDSELHLMINGALYMQPILSIDTSCNLFDLMDIPKNENGIKWFIAQIILATKWRSNSIYRSQLSISHTSPVENIQDAFVLIQDMNTRITEGQVMSWAKYKEQLSQQLRQKILRSFRLHPLNDLVPLSIYDDKHLQKINTFIPINQSMKRTMTSCGDQTMMARSHYLSPNSVFFLKPNPSSIIHQIYGDHQQRKDHFLNSLHEYGQMYYNESNDNFDYFVNKLVNSYGTAIQPRDIITLWISFSLGKNGQNPSIIQILSEQLSSYSAKVNIDALPIIQLRYHWYTNPCEYLIYHFSPEGIMQRKQSRLGLTEFMQYLQEIDSITFNGSMEIVDVITSVYMEECNSLDSIS